MRSESDGGSDAYRGERRMGGQLVYTPDGGTLDKHTDVLEIAGNGFDWGPDAARERVLQLAVALLVEQYSRWTAVRYHHRFAAWLQAHIGDADEWTIPPDQIDSSAYKRETNFENRAPEPTDIDLQAIDLDGATFGELRALCAAYGLNEFDDQAAIVEQLRSFKADGTEPSDVSSDADSKTDRVAEAITRDASGDGDGEADAAGGAADVSTSGDGNSHSGDDEQADESFEWVEDPAPVSTS